MKKGHILLAEDNEGDIVLTQEVLAESPIIRKLSIVRNGNDAIDFILKQHNFKTAETPDIILLDLNLPLKNGFEVLQVIKSNENTRMIPVIMLTTSSSLVDIRKSYQFHANSYITKPIDIKQFIDTLSDITRYWLALSKLPA